MQWLKRVFISSNFCVCGCGLADCEKFEKFAGRLKFYISVVTCERYMSGGILSTTLSRSFL